MTEEPATTIFEELAFDPQYAHLWDEMAHWNAEVTREPEPWGLAGPTPLIDLMEKLAAQLTPHQVVQAERMALAELWARTEQRQAADYLEGLEEFEKEVADECSEDGPVGDADVADPVGGPAVVDEGDRSDPGDPDRS